MRCDGTLWLQKLSLRVSSSRIKQEVFPLEGGKLTYTNISVWQVCCKKWLQRLARILYIIVTECCLRHAFRFEVLLQAGHLKHTVQRQPHKDNKRLKRSILLFILCIHVRRDDCLVVWPVVSWSFPQKGLNRKKLCIAKACCQLKLQVGTHILLTSSS